MPLIELTYRANGKTEWVNTEAIVRFQARTDGAGTVIWFDSDPGADGHAYRENPAEVASRFKAAHLA